jgi:hypothetical protein
MSATLSGVQGGSPIFGGNFFSVIVGPSTTINAGDSNTVIVYNSILTTSPSISLDTSTGEFTLNYLGKYLVNLKVRLNTQSVGVFSPPLDIYLQLVNMTNPMGGRQFFYNFGSNSNNGQATMNWDQIIDNTVVGQNFSLQIALAYTYPGGSFQSAGSIAQGSRSTVTYLGK